MSDVAGSGPDHHPPTGAASGPAVVFDIDVPQYRIDAEPDHRGIGRVVDAKLRERFLGHTVVVRGISADHHPGRSVDDLIGIIRRLGTDRYDPARAGDRYDNLQNKHIDLFAFRRKVTPRMRLFEAMSWGFYHSSIRAGPARPATGLRRSTASRGRPPVRGPGGPQTRRLRVPRSRP